MGKTISAGIEVPKDSCYWLSGAYGVDLSCDQDHVVVGACGAGREPECPEISWEGIRCCPIPLFHFGHCDTYGSFHGQSNSCLYSPWCPWVQGRAYCPLRSPLEGCRGSRRGIRLQWRHRTQASCIPWGPLGRGSWSCLRRSPWGTWAGSRKDTLLQWQHRTQAPCSPLCPWVQDR